MTASVAVSNLIARSLLDPGTVRPEHLQTVPEHVIKALRPMVRTAWKHVSEDVYEHGIANPERILQRADGDAGTLTEFFAALMNKDIPEDVSGILLDIQAAGGDVLSDASEDRMDISVAANRTDVGNAVRLARSLNGLAQYCFPWRCWMMYDGARWKKDDQGGMLAAAKKCVRQMYAEAVQIADEDRRKKAIAHAMSSETERGIRAMVNLAQSEPGIPVKPSDFDQDKYLLNCLNGTINLRTGTLKPHEPADLITKLVPVSFDEGASAPRWTQFLREIFRDNTNVIAAVQRWVGYSLTGDTKEQCFVIGHGTGANGKSVFINTLNEVLGDYAATTPFKTFTPHRGDGVRNDVAALHNVRLVSASEAPEGVRLDEELIKRLTGGDPVAARYLFSEYFTFTPAFKIFLATNHKPRIKGTDLAIWRRVLLLPFENTFTGDACDPDLAGKLLAEAPGILTWAVCGAVLWGGMGIKAPEEVRQATAKYQEEEDILSGFIGECCETDPNLTQPARALYLAFKEYCGGHAISEKAFSTKLEGKGLKKTKVRKGMVWSGIALLTS
jgi:putative DNA primase/helicase